MENIEIHDNSGFIAQAERQCVNARIQGGAATMTKISMIKIHKDEESFYPSGVYAAVFCDGNGAIII